MTTSPREMATDQAPHLRTVQDYLVIISEHQGVCFGEYDNVHLLFDMVRQGLISLDLSKNNRHTSMGTSLWPMLTDAGRQALKEDT